MAKSFATDSGTLYIPGAYSNYKVQSNPSGLATTGVLMLVGEADAGPVYSLETDLETNAYGPDQMADVIAKYGSGPLVDAFRAATAPADDPDITGSFSSCILVKTNTSAKATGNLPAIGGGTYAVLADRSYGKPGNSIAYRTTSAQAEAIPTTGAFTYIPPVGVVDYRIRSNGGAGVGTTIGANTTPTALVSLIDALAGVTATGGATRNLLTAAGGRTITIDAFPLGTTANTVLITISSAWDNTPTIGDTLVIPSTAPAGIADPAGGATNENVGAYVITGATATTITAVKLSDAGRGGAVAGVITAPADVTPAVAIAAASDLVAYAPVTITQDAGAVIAGAGKCLEIADLAGADLLTRTAFVLGTTNPVSWISTSAAPTVLASTAEYQVKLDVNNSSTLASESFTAGGDIALHIGYDGTTATMTLTDTTLTTTVAGGSGASLSLTLSDYGSIQAMVDYIATQAGYTASVGTASMGQLPLAALDNVTAIGICGEHGSKPGRVKIDGYTFFDTVSNGSAMVQVGDPAEQAGAGLPDVMAAQVFLSGGTRGGTTDAVFTAAMTALETVRGNFLVPLFSRNATLDIADGLTDASSTYTIAGIHAAAKSHVLAMSTLKRRRNRQAFLSVATDFATSKNTAANIASFRCSMAFEDFKNTGSSGSVEQHLPWMGSVLAAAMQAAGFYKNIEYKGINTSGVLHRAADFNPKNDSQVESALKAGLLVARPALTGGFIWLSDQTTYGKDNNFVFNSIQAVYAADTVSLTLAQRMETAFVGQSVADVSAPVARAFAEGALADMLRLKLIAPSDDDAPKGWKNLSIKIRGNAMLVSVEIKLATAIDFIKIDFLVSAVQQAA